MGATNWTLKQVKGDGRGAPRNWLFAIGKQVMETQNIRIRLKAFDHRVLDQATGDIAGRVVDSAAKER